MLFDQKLLNQVQEFIQVEVAGKSRYYDVNELFPERLWIILGQEIGIFHLLVDYPDAKKGFRTFLEIVRILSKEFPSLASIAYTHGIYAIQLLQEFGTEAQKQRYLDDLVNCRKMGAFAFSEKDINIENQPLETTAEKLEQGWLVSGRKHKIANVTMADVLFVLARTIDKQGRKRSGVFIIELPHIGVKIGPSVDKMGLRAMPLAPIQILDVRVRDEDLLGGELEGLQQWSRIRLRMWSAISAQSIGIAEGAFQSGIACSQVKRNFGKRPIDVEINQFKFSDLNAKLISCEAYYDECLKAEVIEEWRVSILKLLTSEMARAVSEEVLRITGAYSFLGNHDMERFVLDAEVASTYGGSSDSIRKKIAKVWL
ncbi:TPA: acyl-CoA dehydrogenase family protein [Streptococcus suis]|nr:acyl-CoA dehydrogenase family protein [Streptococcus suis]